MAIKLNKGDTDHTEAKSLMKGGVYSRTQDSRYFFQDWAQILPDVLKKVFVEVQFREWLHWLAAWILFMHIHDAHLNCQVQLLYRVSPSQF